MEERQQKFFQESRFGRLPSLTPSGILILISDSWYELHLSERIYKWSSELCYA